MFYKRKNSERKVGMEKLMKSGEKRKRWRGEQQQSATISQVGHGAEQRSSTALFYSTFHIFNFK